jgi:hypothetical protein
MSEKILSILTRETGGKSYKAHKYSLDNAERTSIEYSEHDKQITWKKTAETQPNRSYVDIETLSKKIKSNQQILNYFLDGSRRVFKVDENSYPDSSGRSKIYPIIAGQIGVACCYRKERKMVSEKFKRELVIAVPDIANADGKSGFFPAIVKKVNDSSRLKEIKLNLASILQYKTNNEEKKFEDRGIACIQDRMIEREKELVAELVKENKLNHNNYLVKDGSLEYRPPKEYKNNSQEYQIFKNNYNWVVGISKNFNAEICIDITGRPNPSFIAELPLYHRTPVACFENKDFLGDIQFAVWYLRIRDTKKTKSPFDGIVKVEKILVTEEEKAYGMNSESVNLLSALIINERNPVCYGSDGRWANHIYPIYLTESFAKSKYISAESFMQLF